MLFLTQWHPEVRQYCPAEVPIILVGTKLDLREDPDTIKTLQADNKAPLKYTDGLRLQRKIGAVKYMECSAKTLDNLHNVFNEAAKEALEAMKPKKKPSRCIIL